MATSKLRGVQHLQIDTLANLAAEEAAGNAPHDATISVDEDRSTRRWDGSAWSRWGGPRVGSSSGDVPTIPVPMSQLSSPVKTTIDGITAAGGNSAAYHPASDFATSAQGAKADTALQAADVANKINSNDSRLTDARTPTAHASTHASGGSDAVTIAESQVTNLVSDLAAKVPTTRAMSTTAPLAGGGDLSANRTLSIPKATGSVDGYLAATDFAAFNSKQGALSFGNITGSNGIGVTGGTGAVVGSGVALSLSSVPNSALANSSVTVNGTANQINGGGSVALGGTITLSLAALVARTTQSVTTGAGAFTVTPTAEIVFLTCTSASGATATISETGAVTGSRVTFVNIGANSIIFAEQAGVMEMSGNFTLGQWDAASFVYIGDRWVEIARSNN